MSHSFFLLVSDELEAVVNVAASSQPRLDRFLGSMVEKGWTVSRTDADTYRSFSERNRYTRVLDHVEATYKVREGVLTEK